MSKVKLLASWVDGKAFGEVWKPIDRAEEFLLLSCYLSKDGLRTLIEQLVISQVREAELVFSLAGIMTADAVALARRLYEYVSQPSSGFRLQAYLVLDERGRLFHPKAHGSKRKTQYLVVAGSANLTTAGMGGNYELVTRIDNDREADEQLAQAITQLKKDPQVIDVSQHNLDVLIAAVQQRAAAQPPHPSRQPETSWPITELDWERREPVADAAPTPETVSGIDESGCRSSDGQGIAPADALRAIRGLLAHGHFLMVPEPSNLLTVPIHLDKFEKADIFRLKRSEAIGTVLAIERFNGLSVHLLPPSLRERRKRLSGTLGKLVGRFTISILGTKWMPKVWRANFKKLWQEQIAARGLTKEKVLPQIEAHLETMKTELRPGGRYFDELRSAFEFQAIEKWNWPATCRLLNYGPAEPRPSHVTESLWKQVLNQVLKHIHDTVTRQARTEYVLAQIAGLGQRPRLRATPEESIDMWDALQVLAEWTHTAVESQFRYGTDKIKNPRNMSAVGKVLVKRFKGDATAAYQTARQWLAYTADADTTDPAPLLAVAWRQFSVWFGLSASPFPWSTSAPTYPDAVVRHSLGLILLNEKNPFGPWIDDKLNVFEPKLTRQKIERIWNLLLDEDAEDKAPLEFVESIWNRQLEIGKKQPTLHEYWAQICDLLSEEGLLLAHEPGSLDAEDLKGNAPFGRQLDMGLSQATS